MKKKYLSFLFLFFLILPFQLLGQDDISNITYEIWVELDPSQKMLYGKEDILWENKTQDEVHDMWFHLYYNAFKNEQSTLIQESKKEWFGPLEVEIKKGGWGWIDVESIKLADGTDLTPTMAFITQDKPVHPDDRTVMRVVFPQPVKPGEKVHLKLQFKAKIPQGVLRTGYYQDSYFIAQWYPKPGVYEEGKGWNCHEYHLSSEFYADFADFTVHIKVPPNLVVGASGKLIRTEPENKKVIYTYHQENIHDFAWTADPNFIKVERDFIAEQEVSPEEYQEVAQKLGLPVENVKLHDIQMILLIRKEHHNQIERHFKALKSAIKYYGLWYGAYPYETITMVDPPFRTGSGGMEYPTLFTSGTRILGSKQVLSPESVIIHEFGHGYWYGLCANNEFEEAWLDEGINTYCEGKVTAKAYGPGTFSLSFNHLPLSWFFELPQYYNYELERAAGIQVVELDPIIKDSWKFYNRGSYGLNVYHRASTCLYTLERLVGKETMLRILRTFQMRYRYKHPHTQDFIELVNEITGKKMNWFFEQLFHNTLNFDYGISSVHTQEKKRFYRGIYEEEGKKVEYTTEKIKKMRKKREKSEQKERYVSYVRVRRYGEAKVGPKTPLRLKVVFEDGSQEIIYWDGQERWKDFTFEKTAKVKYAHLDPERVWLVDSNLTNNSQRREKCSVGVWKLSSQILFWIQYGLQMVSSLS